MMIYVALLRGINVGGNNKIKMADLKRAFESLEFKNVKTYLHSGNIIFQAPKESQTILALKIEAMIHSVFDLKIPVLIKDQEDLASIIEALPVNWENNATMKSDVLFLWDGVDQKTLLEQIQPNPAIDTVKLVSGAILWTVSREKLNKSRLKQIISLPLYKQTTIRNVNTTRKIFELMNNLSES